MLVGAPQVGVGSKAAALGFRPTDIGGCKLWLRGDLGVTGSSPVTGWADQSGNGNHASALYGSVGVSTIGGQPALNFPGSAAMSGSVSPVTGNRTIVVVVQSADTAGGGLFCIRKTSSSIDYIWLDVGPVYIASDGAAVNSLGAGAAGHLDTSPHIARWTEAGSAQCTFRVDTTDCVVGGGGFAAESGTAGYGIGARIYTGSVFQPWNGKIAELCVYDSVLGPTDYTTLYAYLSARYGI